MRTEHMREFVVLAKTLNYGETARQLFISQSSLTRHVNALEEELGATLLDRSQRSVGLTEAGRLARDGFEKALAACAELAEGIDGLALDFTDTLRFGAGVHGICWKYGNPLIAQFWKRCPRTRMRPSFVQSSQIVGQLVSGQLDAGVGFITSQAAAENISSRRIGREPLCAVMSASSPLAAHEMLSPQDFEGRTVVLSPLAEGRVNHAEAHFARHDVAVAEYLWVEDIYDLARILGNRDAVFLGTRMYEGMPGEDLVFIDIDDAEFSIDVGLMYRPGNPAVTELLACAEELFGTA